MSPRHDIRVALFHQLANNGRTHHSLMTGYIDLRFRFHRFHPSFTLIILSVLSIAILIK